MIEYNVNLKCFQWAEVEHSARRTEPIDELYMNTIYGIQFSGPSAPNTLHPRLLKKCCLFPNPRVFRAPDLWYTFAFFEHENHEFICEGQRVGDVTQLRFCLNVISITYLFNVWSLLNWKQWTSWTEYLPHLRTFRKLSLPNNRLWTSRTALMGAPLETPSEVPEISLIFLFSHDARL